MYRAGLRVEHDSQHSAWCLPGCQLPFICNIRPMPWHEPAAWAWGNPLLVARRDPWLRKREVSVNSTANVSRSCWLLSAQRFNLHHVPELGVLATTCHMRSGFLKVPLPCTTAIQPMCLCCEHWTVHNIQRAMPIFHDQRYDSVPTVLHRSVGHVHRHVLFLHC